MPSRHPVAGRGACCGSYAATRLGALDQDGRRRWGRVRHTDGAGRCRAFRIAGGPLPAVDAARPPGQNCRQHGGDARQAGSNEDCRPAFAQEHCRWGTVHLRVSGSGFIAFTEAPLLSTTEQQQQQPDKTRSTDKRVHPKQSSPRHSWPSPPCAVDAFAYSLPAVAGGHLNGDL